MRLFSTFTLKNLQLKNRIVLPPLASFLIKRGGGITEATVEHYKQRAAGGPAMVIMEACAVSSEGVVSANQARIDEDRHLEGLSRLAAAIKSEGAVAAIQIHHAGRQTSPKVIGRNPLAPSPLPCPTIRGDVEPMTLGGIGEIIDKFADAAVRAREAGFELLEIHGAHGYLINQFLSGYSNIRQDQYGGSLVRRAQFAIDIITEIRRRLGPQYPLSFKISAQEFVPGGLTVNESIEILQLLIDAGIDTVQVSAGNDSTPEWICQPMFMPKACLADSAARIKQVLDIPVMAVGRINDPWTAEDVITSGKADLVCIGRGLMADPEMPNKAREGRFDEIRICIACNTCMQSIFKKGRLECLVNPILGREKELQIIPARKPRKVMVVGGGPSGMNTAWVAAKRGHEVHLYEKQQHLGGLLVPGSQTSYKREMLSLIRFQQKQVELNAVICHLGCEVTAATVKELNPDVVVLATGSAPLMPQVDGIDNSMVFAFDAILTGRDLDRCDTVVIGGGATGCEVAYHLVETGSAVTIVEMTPKIGGDLEAVTRKVLVGNLKQKNTRILVGHRLLAVEKEGVIVAGPDNQEKKIAAQRIVIAIGIRPNNKIHDQVKSLGYETHIIGDCLEPRTAKAAILDAARLGRSI